MKSDVTAGDERLVRRRCRAPLLKLLLSSGRDLLPAAKLSLNQAQKDRQPRKYLVFLEGVFFCIIVPYALMAAAVAVGSLSKLLFAWGDSRNVPGTSTLGMGNQLVRVMN